MLPPVLLRVLLRVLLVLSDERVLSVEAVLLVALDTRQCIRDRMGAAAASAESCGGNDVVDDAAEACV